MQTDMVTTLLNKFNDMIDSLLDDYSQFRDDEQTLAFLAKRTRNFISSTNLALNNIVFTLIEKMNNEDYDISDEIQASKQMINHIFEQMTESVNHILEHENDEEEEEHVHDHNHEHHVHVDVEGVQDDIDKLQKYLKILKKIFISLISIIISFIKYQTNETEEKDFIEDYANFKEDINSYINEFEETTKL